MPDSLPRRLLRAIPAVLAFLILAIQVSIPWTVKHLETTDGSSYVYSAVVARDLISNPHSVYAPAYQFQKRVVPNWGTTMVLSAILSFVDAARAEQLLMSLYLLIGFFCFSYCTRSIDPGAGWSPIANFVLQNWLLWTGFYNFYLGTLLGLVLIGFYIRHAKRLSAWRAVALSLGLLAIFMIHLMAAAIAGLAICVIAVWTFAGAPRRLLPLFAALLPAIALAAFFAISSGDPPRFTVTIAGALAQFPMQLFTTAAGRFGSQMYLWPVMFGLIIAAFVFMRRPEWTGIRGAMAAVTASMFLAYLVIPDEGFGGGWAKRRFLWAIFLFGGMLVMTASRLERIRVPVALYAAGCLFANLAATNHALHSYSAAVEDYMAAIGDLPHGASLIRIRYSTPDIPQRYGYDDLWRDPLLRVDGLAAAECQCIDLSEYQAATRIFPIIYKPGIDRAAPQGSAVNFASPDRHTSEKLAGFLENDAHSPDYVILVADRLSSETNLDPQPDFPRVLAVLGDAGYELTGASRRSSFVRVYRRPGAK